MIIYRDAKSDTMYVVDGYGYPMPIPPEEAFRLISQEGYRFKLINDEVDYDVDIENIKKVLEEMPDDEPLNLFQEKTVRFLDNKRKLARKDLTDYFAFAANTKIDIPYAELYENKTFIQKGSAETLGYQIKDNLYLFQFGSRYYYGHLIDNADYYHFIGVCVPDTEEVRLLELVRVDFNIKNGTLI